MGPSARMARTTFGSGWAGACGLVFSLAAAGSARVINRRARAVVIVFFIFILTVFYSPDGQNQLVWIFCLFPSVYTVRQAKRLIRPASFFLSFGFVDNPNRLEIYWDAAAARTTLPTKAC